MPLLEKAFQERPGCHRSSITQNGQAGKTGQQAGRFGLEIPADDGASTELD